MPAHPTKELTEGGFEAVAERFRMMGDPLRLKLLNHLRSGERSVGELVEATGASQPNVSKHLSLLRHAGLVSRRQEGTSVYYAVTDPVIFNLCEIVCDSIERKVEGRHGPLRL